MPDKNGVTNGGVGNALNAERQWRHRGAAWRLNCRGASRERTKRRKAMETRTTCGQGVDKRGMSGTH